MQEELFSNEDIYECENEVSNSPVTIFGKTFKNDKERRQYFCDELRKKLPELKKIEGYPIGEDDDIIKLSDPPFYTTCPNPWLNDFVSNWENKKEKLEQEGKRKSDFHVKEPYANDVSEGKNNPVYTALSYHTKVPHPAIMRYILHYTQPGDIILDGFSGTGMTGVAAQACGNPTEDQKRTIEKEFLNLHYDKPVWGQRHAITGDLSPYASFISFNYNTPTNPNLLKNEVKSIFEKVKERTSWMYETKVNNTKARINYVVWSDICICPNCGKEYVYWNTAINKTEKRIDDEFKCPECNSMQYKKNLTKAFKTEYDPALKKSISIVKSTPVIIVCTDSNGKRYENDPTDFDYALLEKIENYKIDTNFYPFYRMPEGGETRRNDKYGITHIHQFFTKRNLIALSILNEEIQNSNINNKAKFILTGIVRRSAKFNRVHISNYFFGGGGWNAGSLSGTLYVPNAPVETSILEQIEDRVNAFIKAIPMLPKEYDNCQYVGTAQKLLLDDNTIDYIFIDPPFGANINYSELNFITEAWLKVFTNNQEEAIVNQSQGKDRLFYLNEMKRCFSEFYRVLKPGKWITIEFSNTSSAIWNAIQNAITTAGFIVANVAALDKKQGGMRSITTATAVRQDLAITCYKPSKDFLTKFTIQDSLANTWSFVEEQLNHLPIPTIADSKAKSVIERSPKVLFDRLITYFFMRGLPVPVDAVDFQEGLRSRFISEDGMIFTLPQVTKYRELKKQHNIDDQPSLFISIIESESDAIQWLKEKLTEKPLKYQDIQPEYRKAYTINRKGEIEIELKDVLEENFIQEPDGTWRIPDMNEEKDREQLRIKTLLKIWNDYCQIIETGNVKKLKDVRLEAIKAGFKDCYQKKDFKRIVTMGDKIPENLLTEDEMLLNYYDIATSKV